MGLLKGGLTTLRIEGRNLTLGIQVLRGKYISITYFGSPELPGKITLTAPSRLGSGPKDSVGKPWPPPPREHRGCRDEIIMGVPMEG